MGTLTGCNTDGGASTPTEPAPESGKLKFGHFTDAAVCSLELERVTSGATIEILDLADTHDKLKPDRYFTYASADYARIDDEAIYHVTATTCDGSNSATHRDFQFDRGGVWSVYNW